MVIKKLTISIYCQWMYPSYLRNQCAQWICSLLYYWTITGFLCVCYGVGFIMLSDLLNNGIDTFSHCNWKDGYLVWCWWPVFMNILVKCSEFNFLYYFIHTLELNIWFFITFFNSLFHIYDSAHSNYSPLILKLCLQNVYGWSYLF